MQYGVFPLSRGELAFKLHLLLFILPATVCATAAIATLDPAARRLLNAFDALRGLRWRWSVVPALVVLGLTGLVRSVILLDAPTTDDENVYLFHARLIASWHLYAPSPPAPIRSFFDNQFVVNDGRWFGMYFIGHPALLALALKAGLLQWVGPIESAFTVLLAAGIARRLFGQRAAILTGLLLALSPFFIFVSATHLSQPSSSLALALFLYAALRVEASPRTVAWWAVMALGLIFGALIRPQVVIALSLPVLARLVILVVRRQLRPGSLPVAIFAILLTLGGVVFLAINHHLTGSVFRTSYHAYWAQHGALPFPTGAVYSLREISQNLAQVNFWLLGWPVSLALVPFFRRSAAAWTLASIPMVALAWYGLMAVPTVSHVGPVYYAESIVPLVILSASGLERAVEWARQRFGDGWPTRALVTWPCASIVLSTLLAFVPVEVASLRLMADIARAPYDLVEERGLDNALVFVHSLPALHKRPGAWVYYHRNNSPDLSDPVLFVRDLGPEQNKVLMDHLPKRAPYLMGMRDDRLVLIPLRP